MRLRIVHQLSLLLVGAVLLAVVAVGAAVAWNLQAGFSDYLRTRDREHLERFAALVSARAERDPGFAEMRPGQLPMRELMDEFSETEGIVIPPRRPRPPPRGDVGPPGEGPRGDGPAPDADQAQGPDSTRPLLRGRPPPDGLARRLQVTDPDGVRIGGPMLDPQRALLDAPVIVRGRVIAHIRMLPSNELAAVDLRFLRRQYLGVGVAAVVTLLLALVVAVLIAPRLGRPLHRLQAATRRIASGELGVVVPASGVREMAALIDDVNHMSMSLKKLEGARRSWVAQISHELRTPLSVLLGELESIEDGARQPTPEVLANLRAEVLQLVRMVNDLHTLSMADLGALPCEFVDGDASVVFARALQRMEERVRKAGLVLDAPKESAPIPVHWDFGRIEQVLVNLVENSLRYTIAPGRLSVTWSLVQARVHLRVEDTPPGVAPADLDQLFEPLFRADRSRHRSAIDGGGSGLGLTICKAIVLAHGGTIRAEPSPLGGLCVVVDLPVSTTD
jgi:two-component system sensor histidine kinase BaeS